MKITITNYAYLYARTDDFFDEKGMTEQLRACRRMAAELGVRLIGRFQECGVANTADDRTELKILLDTIEADNIAYVICADTSTLAATDDQLRDITRQIEAHGASVVIAKGNRILHFDNDHDAVAARG
ncbi:recombinase family protein [Tsukamurella soli]